MPIIIRYFITRGLIILEDNYNSINLEIKNTFDIKVKNKSNLSLKPNSNFSIIGDFRESEEE